MCQKPSGKIWLCLDPIQLDKFVIRLRHNARLVDAMLLRLSGVKHFTIIDCTSSFNMLRLTYTSSLLTAFGIIYGRYRYERMPIGASPSSDILHMTLDHISTLEEYPFMCNIADDIVTVGYDNNGSDHDRNVWQVLKTAHCEGMKFNLDKCMVCSEAIPFFGMSVSKEQMLPDPKKTKALAKLPFPSTVKWMWSFLDIANHLERFTPRLASLTAHWDNSWRRMMYTH